MNPSPEHPSPTPARPCVAALRAHLQEHHRFGHPYETLQTLIDEGFDALPYPGAGATRARWQVLAEVAAYDLCLAKLYESHVDALAILHDLEDPPRPPRAGMHAVWCSESAQARVTLTPHSGDDREVLLRGTKAWCSGASHVRAALVSAWDADTPCLVAVELAQAGIDVCPAHWHAMGMADTQSFTVTFRDARARRVGAPGAYLSRAGFHHGAAGVAACWYGAATGMAEVVRETLLHSPGDPHALAHLGAIDVALAQAASVLRAAAKAIDAHPTRPCLEAVRRARLAVEAAVETILWHAPRAIGPSPMCRNARFARLLADLPVFIRQSHAERDLAAHGRALLERDGVDLWGL